MFWCVVSLYIFKSCAVFWRARRASQNTKNESTNLVQEGKCDSFACGPPFCFLFGLGVVWCPRQLACQTGFLLYK